MQIEKDVRETPARSSERTEIVLARARISILAAHAHFARHLAHLLSDRLPSESSLAIYCERQGLSAWDTEFVVLQARARMNVQPPGTVSQRRHVAKGGAEREESGLFSRGVAWLRDHIDPLGDPGLFERVELDMARATSTIITLHVRHALRLATSLAPTLSGPAAVAMYLDAVEVDRDLHAAVYALALARLAAIAGTLPVRGTIRSH